MFEFYELYRAFLPLYREHREYFYDWCEIGSIYGAPADCLWGGGRVGFGDDDPRRVMELMEQYGMTQEETAQRVGKSRPVVANALRLLKLSSAVQKLVEDGTLSAGHARALIPLNEKEQESAAATGTKKDLSVRQTEIQARWKRWIIFVRKI